MMFSWNYDGPGEDVSAVYDTPRQPIPECDCGACVECRAFLAFRRSEISIEDIDLSTVEELEAIVARVEAHRAARTRIVAQIREMTADCPRSTEVVDVPF